MAETCLCDLSPRVSWSLGFQCDERLIILLRVVWCCMQCHDMSAITLIDIKL